MGLTGGTSSADTSKGSVISSQREVKTAIALRGGNISAPRLRVASGRRQAAIRSWKNLRSPSLEAGPGRISGLLFLEESLVSESRSRASGLGGVSGLRVSVSEGHSWDPRMQPLRPGVDKRRRRKSRQEAVAAKRTPEFSKLILKGWGGRLRNWEFKTC